MKSLLTSLLFSIAAFGLDAAHAFEHPACGTADEAACMLDAIWSAAEHLPAEKQNRLKAPFLETVAKSGDTLLLQHWQARLGADLRREKAVEPYARKKAKAALSRGNWTAFCAMHGQGRSPSILAVLRSWQRARVWHRTLQPDGAWLMRCSNWPGVQLQQADWTGRLNRPISVIPSQNWRWRHVT